MRNLRSAIERTIEQGLYDGAATITAVVGGDIAFVGDRTCGSPTKRAVRKASAFPVSIAKSLTEVERGADIGGPDLVRPPDGRTLQTRTAIR